jgi:hypothetical protein
MIFIVSRVSLDVNLLSQSVAPCPGAKKIEIESIPKWTIQLDSIEDMTNLIDKHGEIKVFFNSVLKMYEIRIYDTYE